jgi:translin
MVRTERPCDGSELFGPAKPLFDLINGPERMEAGILEDPLTEVAEAMVLSRVLEGKELPMPSEVGIPERAYALGLCDALGEMRRVVLNRLLRGELDKAMSMYGSMKELFSIIEGLTYPSGMIQLKRKQDVVRGILDRTAGELAISMTSKRANSGDGGLER